MLAKICSDLDKPDGQTFLKADREAVLEFMSEMEIRKIPGIGRMTELVLNNLGVVKCKDAILKCAEISVAFSDRSSQFIVRSALGISRCFHEQEDEDAIQKSISTSETFRPIKTYDQFKSKIEELSEDLAKRMDKHRVAGTNLTLNMKSTKFDIHSKAISLNSYIW
jgi:DNA polymerase kappa